MILCLSKKFISIVLAICMLLATFTVASANGSDNQENRIVREGKAVENHIKVMNHYNAKYRKGYPDNYAGAYIDEDGNLNINLVEDQNHEGENSESLKKVVNDANVKFHTVKYSLKDLDIVSEKLTPKMIELDIQMIERDDQNDKVYVYFLDLDDAKINEVKEIVDYPFIEFRQLNSPITSTQLI